MELWRILCRWQEFSAHRLSRTLIQRILEVSAHESEEIALERLREADSLIDEISRFPDEAGLRQMESWRSRGVHFEVYGRGKYPEILKECADPPITLSLWGDPSVLQRSSLSVVGSREPAGRSLEWMDRELWSFCRRVRAPLVSGGARGIDQKAHAVALRAGVPTAVFLPSGLERLYPREMESWVRPVLEGGGVFVSEYPLGAEMRKAHFHHRNRLIAAAGRVVLVIEARVKGGTLLTAARAAETGRPLLVVPAHPDEERFAGNLMLLAEGATLVRQAEDLTLFWQAEEISGLVGRVQIGGRISMPT